MTDRESPTGRPDRQAAVNAHFAARLAADQAAMLDRLAAALENAATVRNEEPPQAARVSGAKVDIRVAVVDNPYFQRQHREGETNPRRIRAPRNINESPLVRLEALRTIDAAQAAAGHRFRALVERLMSGRVSPSLVQERVDGQSAPDVFTEARMRASFALAQAAELMTPAQFWCVHFVCGEGRSLRDLDTAGRWRKGRGAELLVASLERLAEIWHLRPANQSTPAKTT